MNIDDLKSLCINDSVEEFWKDVSILEKIAVPSYSSETLRPCSDEDFSDFRSNIDKQLSDIESLLRQVSCSEKPPSSSLKKFATNVVIVAGEHNRKFPWNTQTSVETSEKLVAHVCRIFACKSFAQFLNDDSNFHLVLLALRPKLLKDNWKNFPSAVACYTWLVDSAEEPTLKHHVADVLPTALIILDDFVLENQIIGLNCLSRILQHCRRSRSLAEFNYNEVIYATLEKLSHKSDARIISSLYTCLSTILDIIDFSNHHDDFGWSRRDDALAILLDNMEMQQRTELRLAYLSALPCLLTNSGCGKWSQRLGRIFGEYLEYRSETNLLKKTFEAIENFLSTFRPKGRDFYGPILTSVLKLSIDRMESPFEKEVDEKLEDCIRLLEKWAPNVSEEIFSNEQICAVLKSGFENLN